MDIVIVFASALLPAFLMYLWIKKRNSEKPGYAETCKSSFIGGMTAALPIVLMDAALALIGWFTKLSEISEILWVLYRTFIMFAFAEELWKYLSFKGVLKKSKCEYSWHDTAAFMMLVGLGFEILESAITSLTMSPIAAIIRGVTMMHGVFGFIMGYYYGKSVYTGKKGYRFLAFLLPYFYHAVYDFTLSPVLNDYDWVAIIPVSLAIISAILVVVIIIFFKKARKEEKYMTPLIGGQKRVID